MPRKITRAVRIGEKILGGGNPVLIQSMTNTATENVQETVAQIHRLEEAGCELIRCAVPTKEAANALSDIKKHIRLPLVADIHFDYRLAILAMENGADKIRINPGNIGGNEKLQSVIACAKEREIPIRVGVNGGSLEKELLEKHGGVTAKALVESAVQSVRLIEDMGYDKLVLSIKASDVPLAICANEALSDALSYPIHIGITEAGGDFAGTVKSAVGLGVLLNEGIGDTIRVSLTADPEKEIRAAREILRSLHLRDEGAQVVSCPTCGRTKINLISLAKTVEEMASSIQKPIKIAVMGCVVNGPGEARDADVGICGGSGCGLIFRKGQVVRKVPEDALLLALKEELEKMHAYH